MFTLVSEHNVIHIYCLLNTQNLQINTSDKLVLIIFQVTLDDHHILIIGGCGGPNQVGDVYSKATGKRGY